MKAASPTLDEIRSRGRKRARLPDQELADWTWSVRALLTRTDSLLERLEGLNVLGQAHPPRDLEEITRAVLEPDELAGRNWTVQELLDRVLDAQEPILCELRACRTERLLRAGASRRRPPRRSAVRHPGDATAYAPA